MAYNSVWERLSDAATRVMTEAGISNDEAKSDICQAIADGTVKIRGKLERHTTEFIRSSKTVLEGKDFEIRTDLKSEDLDWERSRPVKAWRVRRGHYSPPGYWDLEWIELFSPDVTKVLCPAASRGETVQRASSPKGKKPKVSPRVEAQNARSRSYTPKGCRTRPLYRMRRCVGLSVKSLRH